MSIFEAFMMVTIVVGGGFALYKLGVFRDLKPHLTLEQSVTHRLMGDDYVHIGIQVSLTNTSKVAVDIREAMFRIQQISPLSNEEVEMLYEDYYENEIQKQFQWPTTDEITRIWQPSELIIEPGESHSETYEFIITNELESVLIYAYFFNSRYSPGKKIAKGWEVTTVYDVY